MRPSGEGSSSVGVWRIATLAVAGAVLVQCGPAPPPPAATSPPSAASPTAPAAATIQPVTAADLGPSWHPGCPIDPRQLRRVEVNYIGFDDKVHRGDLIVHEDLAAEVVAIFEQLLQLRYPIDKIRTADNYPAPTMSCRWRTTTPRRITAETFPAPAAGLNTYSVMPSTSTRCSTPRSMERALSSPRTRGHTSTATADPGLLHGGDPIVRAFTDRGWRWGGDWRTPIDYQHFER
jgi:hypothetical protein